jgi:hypothetical protein
LPALWNLPCLSFSISYCFILDRVGERYLMP